MREANWWIWKNCVDAGGQFFPNYEITYNSDLGQDILTWTKEDETTGYGVFFNVPEGFQNWK